MEFRNIFLAGLVATTAMVASADVTYLRGRHRVGPREENTVVRVTFRHVPNSDPDDPFHDTYARNLGRRRDIAEKPVANIHAKISAARYDEERAEARREERAKKGAYYSNVKTRAEEAAARKAYSEDGEDEDEEEEEEKVTVNNNYYISGGTVVIN